MKQTLITLRTWLVPLILVAVVVLAFHQTLRMYFWQDDYAFMFRLQHLQEPAGQFGQGLFGSGPYRYIYTWAVPVYHWFGLKPFWYQLYSLLFRLLSLIGVYLLAKELMGRRAAIAAAAIFGSSFVGMETMLRITNTYQTHAGLLLATLAFYFLLRFFNTHHLLHYLVALTLFFLAQELAFVRSHGLIIAVAALFVLRSVGKRDWYKHAIAFVPFLIVFVKIYFLNGTDSPEITNYVKTLFGIDGAKHLLTALNVVGNNLFPDVIINYLTEVGLRLLKDVHLTNGIALVILNLLVLSFARLTKRRFSLSGKQLAIPVGATAIFSVVVILLALKTTITADLVAIQTVVGFAGLVTIGWLTMMLWRDHRQAAIAIAMGGMWLLANVLVYHMRTPSILFESTDRYFTYSSVGQALLVGSLAALLLPKQKPFWWLITAVVVVMIALNITYQYRFVHRLSLPAKQFYRELRSQLPAIPKGSVLFFDINKDPDLGFQFRNFFHVASMPEATAIAVHYGNDRYDFALVDSFEQLINHIKDQPVPLEHVYTFYYDGTLQNTTSSSRAALGQGTPATEIAANLKYESPMVVRDGKSFTKNRGLAIEGLAIPSQAPLEIIIMMKVTLKTPPQFPYYDLTQTSLESDNASTGDLSKIEEELPPPGSRADAFAYLAGAREITKTISASADSAWQANAPARVHDGNFETFWMADRGSWAEKNSATITLELPAAKALNRLRLVNSHPTRTPMRYRIEGSPDGHQFSSLAQVTLPKPLKAGESRIDSFEETSVKSLRVVIDLSSGGDAPAIAELEPIESRFSQVAIDQAKRLGEMPLYGADEIHFKAAQQALVNGMAIQVAVKTNDQKNFREIEGAIEPVFDQSHRYRVLLKPAGTTLQAIRLTPLNFPAVIELSSVTVRQIPLTELGQ